MNKLKGKNIVLSVKLLMLLALLCASPPAPSLAAAPLSMSTSLIDVLHHSHIFGHAAVTLSTSGKRAAVTVNGFGCDDAARRKQAVAAARVLVNSAPAQFTTIFVRYLDSPAAVPYCEVLVNVRDITSLAVGTARLDDILSQLSVVYVQPGQSASQVLDQYLGAAEKQMDLGNFWEAEQIVDAATAVSGRVPEGSSGRFTRDMINLADSFDCWGDSDRAERILRQLIDHRIGLGNLADADGDRSVQHLCDLFTSNKRYQDAETFLQSLLANPALSQTANPQRYAANMERLALIHSRMGQYDQAGSELAAATTVLQGQVGEYSSNLARCYEEMADILTNQGKRDDARASLMRARSIYDHAIVSRIASERIDYQIYNAHVKQIEEKLRRL